MPQEFHVLRCYSCQTFQVHIVKKVNKWSCKMCGEKQSVKKVYGQGTGKDCRLHVQSLNEQRMLNDINESIPFDSNINNEEDISNKSISVAKEASKWNEYINDEQNSDLSETENGNGNYTFEQPKKRKLTKDKHPHTNTNPKKIKHYADNSNDKSEENQSNNILNELHQPENDEPKCNAIMNENLSDNGNITKVGENYKNKSKWSCFVSDFDDNDTSNVIKEDEVKKNSTNIPRKDFGGKEPEVLNKDEICKKESKWNMFLPVNETNVASSINCSPVSNNIFSSIDIDSLDDILDF